MNPENINLKFIGVSPLLMHNGRLADPLDPNTMRLAAVTGKRRKTRADHERIAELEWYGALWLDGLRPCLPCESLEAAFTDGAKTRNKGPTARSGLVVNTPALLHYEGPDNLKELWADENFRLRSGVRVRNARTMRTRPRFPSWSANVTASFLPTLLDRAEVVEFFRIAGSLGIGDWRPRYGKIIVEELAM
jgi:hypothetical protein